MKRIKVIATLFVLLSAGMVNYQNNSGTSVDILNKSELVMCADSKNVCKNPVPFILKCRTDEAKACTVSEGTDTNRSSGKNYDASMVIM